MQDECAASRRGVVLAAAGDPRAEFDTAQALLARGLAAVRVAKLQPAAGHARHGAFEAGLALAIASAAVAVRAVAVVALFMEELVVVAPVAAAARGVAGAAARCTGVFVVAHASIGHGHTLRACLAARARRQFATVLPGRAVDDVSGRHTGATAARAIAAQLRAAHVAIALEL